MAGALGADFCLFHCWGHRGGFGQGATASLVRDAPGEAGEFLLGWPSRLSVSGKHKPRLGSKENACHLPRVSLCRQHKLEEALLFSGQFMDALQALVDWLYKVEPQLAEDQPVHGDLDLVMNLMDAHKVMAEVQHEECEKRSRQPSSSAPWAPPLQQADFPSALKSKQRWPLQNEQPASSFVTLSKTGVSNPQPMGCLWPWTASNTASQDCKLSALLHAGS